MHTILVAVACTALALLGLRSILAGQVGTGLASLMLAAANWILLTRQAR